jgi:hypothetical protein
MKGPFTLTQENVDKVKAEPGAYILGGKSSNGKYWGCYVGRSDEDISNRLQHWLDLMSGDRDPENDTDLCLLGKNPDRYWRVYTATAREAFDEECRVYHKHGYSCNSIHPAKSSRRWTCLICGE